MRSNARLTQNPLALEELLGHDFGDLAALPPRTRRELARLVELVSS